MIGRFVDVKLQDGTYKAIKTSDIEQMFLDKQTGDIFVFWKEDCKTCKGEVAYWERNEND